MALATRSAKQSPQAARAEKAGSAGEAAVMATIYLSALILSLAWAAAIASFAWGYDQGLLFATPFGIGVVAMIAFGPGALICAAAFLVRQAIRLARDDRRLMGMLNSLSLQDPAARLDAAALPEFMRAVEAAELKMSAFRRAVVTELDRLN